MIQSVLKFLAGSVFSLGAMLATAYLIFTVSVAAFDYGRGLGSTLIEYREPLLVEITLANPTTLDEVSRILYERGLIHNALMFRIENFLMGNTADFAPGTFLVSSEMSAAQMAGAIRATNFFTDVQIRIGEGFTNADIASYLEGNDIMTAEEFLTVANEVEFDFDFLPGVPQRNNRLQGYLFPDTYMIPANANANQVIARQLQRFEDIFDNDRASRATELGLTMDEIVIMASIVERETRMSALGADRNRFAAVIANRLALDMPLEMVSTVAYAVDRPFNLLTPADFATESPHNTFLFAGLPYGPICNPSAASIDAVLFPYDYEYLYALLVDVETGLFFFTADREEYLRARQEADE
ncbi:MAG: endolytic transglycosylase MltG [Defluviitaleaceae bacterium]|nr:endolytic transglycosylase MltG [Defluviitaleaceae bacterium]